MSARNWIVSISSEHDDPLILGPYSERRARQVKAAFNRREERREDFIRDGDFLYASAMPISNPGPRDIVDQIFGPGSGR